MKKYAIIVAGGSGQRMGTDVPKQFLLLNGLPILQYSIVAFLQAFNDVEVVLVLPAEHIDKGKSIIGNIHSHDKVQITTGGDTRFQSVKNGLQLVREPSIIFVHDGVRCLITAALIKHCYEQAIEKGSAIPTISPTDSLRMINNNEQRVIDRNDVRIIQTPQTFRSDILLSAFNQTYQPSFTDEATVVEAAGNKVFLVKGDHDNIKITRPIDLLIAEQILQNRSLLKQS